MRTDGAFCFGVGLAVGGLILLLYGVLGATGPVLLIAGIAIALASVAYQRRVARRAARAAQTARTAAST